jgi:hypothetical protein
MASSSASFFDLHLALRRRAHADHRHAAGELGEALLEFLTVVVARRLVDLSADLFARVPRSRPRSPRAADDVV